MRVPVIARPTIGPPSGSELSRDVWLRRRLPMAVTETWLRGHSALLYLFLYAPLAALGMRSAPHWLRLIFEGVVYMTIITPEIVVAVASLVYFVLLLPLGQGLQAMVVTHAVY